MDWIFPVAKKWYDLLSEGTKKVEGRVPDVSKPEKNYANLNPGDLATFIAVDENYKTIKGLPQIKFKVKYNKKYSSVKKMLAHEGLDRVLPGVESIEEGIKIYHSFPEYEERIKRDGIHAIGLERKID
jgi:ASC-1-like (ASCH) protein